MPPRLPFLRGKMDKVSCRASCEAEDLTSMDSTSHTRNESIDTIRLLYVRYQRRYSRFVISRVFEVRKDEFLEGIYLVLEIHQVADSLETR